MAFREEAASAVAEAILALSPSSYWKLDEASGTFADSVGAVTGTAVGTPAYSQVPITPGSSGTSIRFDNADGDRIDFGDVYNFTGASQFTALCWMKPTTWNAISGHHVWSNSDGGGNGWVLYLAAPAVTWTMVRGDAAGFNSVTYLTTEAEYENGIPKMVAMRYDGTNLILNINGVDVISGASAKSMTNGEAGLSFGAFNGGGSGFDGSGCRPCNLPGLTDAGTAGRHL